MKKRKMLWMTIALSMVLQLLAPINLVTAVDDEVPHNQIDVTNADLIIKDAGGNVITPTAGGEYTNVPKNAKIQINFAFSLLDNGPAGEEYTYHSGQTYTIDMPAGIVFSVPAEGIPVETSGGSTTMGALTISGSKAVITFNSYVDEISGNSKMGGAFTINGTFDSSVTGNPNPAPISFTFNGTTITINVAPDPAPDVTIDTEKSGVYDSQTNTIIWTVKVKPTNATGSGISVEDVYSGNQTYVGSSFAVDGTTTSAGLTVDESINKLTYNFPYDIAKNEEKIITYQTKPAANAFSTETKDNEAVKFENTATVKIGTDKKGDATAKILVNWIEKGGSVDSSDFTLIHWTVGINNGEQSIDSKNQTTNSSLTINNPVVTDIIPKGLDLVPGTVKLDGTAVELDNSPGGPAAGKYSYTLNGDSTNTLTYKYNGQLTGKKTLAYDTKVTDPNADLNHNGQVPYQNNAKLSWDENVSNTYGIPWDGFGVGVGKSVISKSAGGTITYVNGTNDIITWTVKVNENKVNITNAAITDTFPAGLEYVNDSFNIDDKTGSGFNGTLTTSPSGIQYEFKNSGSPDDRVINSTYTITYKTKVTDHSKFFTNNQVSFTNSAKILGGGLSGNLSTGVTQKFNSEVVKKSIVAGYDYTTRRVKWQIAVNANKIPMTAAVIADTIPVGMAFIDSTFEVRNESGVLVTTDAGILTPVIKGNENITDQDSFNYKFKGTNDTGKYIITYETEMKEKYLQTNQFATRDFTNTAVLSADNYTGNPSSSVPQAVKNPVIEKTGDYQKGTDYVNWVVPINKGKVSWPNGITISDQLQPQLELDVDSVKLYHMDLKPDGSLTKTGSGTPIPASDYNISYNNKLFTLTIPGSINDAYQLEFTTDVLTDTANISNSITFQGASLSAGSTASAISVNINDASASGYGKQGKITIIKEDAGDSSLKLNGAKFQLYDINKLPIPGKIGDTVNGQLDFFPLKFRTFYIGEIQAPNGYLLNTELKKVKIDSETPVLVSFKDQKAAGSILFQKQTASGQPLGGAEFTLYKKGSSAALQTAKSDNTGKVVFNDVPTGEYEIKETKAPGGYYASSDIIDAKVEADITNTSIQVTLSKNVIKNTPIPGTSFGNVVVTKTNEGGKPLSGAKFTLYNVNGVAVQSGVSGTDGKVSFNNLIPGSYSIRETEAPEGYEITSSDTAVTVSGDTKAVTIVNKAKKVIGSITVIKTDDKGKTLEGAECSLSDEKGTIISKAVTDANGQILFKNLPEGNYTVSEIKAPDGYEIEKASFKVTVDSTATKTVTFVNKKLKTDSNTNEGEKGTGTIAINKIDGSSKPLAGAEFTLFDANGKIIDTAVSGKDGQAVFKGIKAGSYMIQETKAPAGYALVSAKLNVKLEAGQALKLNFRNIREEELADNKIPLGWVTPDNNKVPEGAPKGGKLPQAGEWMDTFMMLAIGAVLVVLGAVPLALRKRHRKTGN